MNPQTTPIPVVADGVLAIRVDFHSGRSAVLDVQNIGEDGNTTLAVLDKAHGGVRQRWAADVDVRDVFDEIHTSEGKIDPPPAKTWGLDLGALERQCEAVIQSFASSGPKLNKVRPSGSASEGDSGSPSST